MRIKIDIYAHVFYNLDRVNEIDRIISAIEAKLVSKKEVNADKTRSETWQKKMKY